MEIENHKLTSKGTGGSYTRWQGKPPGHIQMRFDLGDKDYVGDFYFSETFDEDDLKFRGVIDQVTSDYKFDRLPKKLRKKMKQIAKEEALESGWFGLTKEDVDKEKLKEVS